MKKLTLIFLALLMIFSADAAVLPSENPDAKSIKVVLPWSNQTISLAELATLTPKQYKALTGKKLTLAEKIQLKISQRQARKLIEKDGTVNAEKWKKKFGFFDRWSWHWGGFALGFLFLIGPIICLFINDDYKWDRFWTAMTVTAAIASAATILISAGL
jgi:hypothetical protein